MSFQSRNLLFASSIALGLSASQLFAQAVQKRDVTPDQQEPTTVIRSSTQLVVIDVIVQDQNGNPVHGLSSKNFRLVENKAPQTIRRFEEFNNATQKEAPRPPSLRPGEFTNFTPIKNNAPLNVLLVDQINTAPGDQLYLQDQLRKYIEHSSPDARIAIIGMKAGRLSMIQGFTSDPALLKDTIENHLKIGLASPVSDAGGFNEVRNALETSGTSMPEAIQKVAEAASDETKLRMALSLDAFDQLARYLSSFPGRKNLIWFSGSFPLSIMPDTTLSTSVIMGNPFAVMGNAEAQYRRVTNTLTRAQVAIYPVDARGVRLAPAFDNTSTPLFNAKPNNGTIPAPGQHPATDFMAPIIRAQRAELSTDVNDHNTMDRMADDTGGKAFYANNDLGLGLKSALDSGANYYTLDYSPTDHKWDGNYRSVHVELTGEAAGRKLKLSYRKGYYADAPTQTFMGKSTTALSKDDSQAKSSAAFARAALTRGTPEPTEILFKARVLPGAAKVEDVAVFGNHITTAAKGPYRRYSVDFAAIASDFTWLTQPDGQRLGGAEFGVLVYDKDGHLLNTVTKGYQLHATPEEYKALLKDGVQVHEEVSAPVKGDTYFRIAIHDLYSDKYGAVEIPASRVAQLQASPATVPTLGARPIPQ